MVRLQKNLAKGLNIRFWFCTPKTILKINTNNDMETLEKQAVKPKPENILVNETIKTVYERRAVRKYKDIVIERKIIEQLVDAGRMAPSAINKQSWKFYVLTNKEDIKIFSKEISKA